MEIPAIHPDTIEEVKQRIDIADVISDYVVLRKRGKDLVGLCPFHEEKTPSFTVSPNKQVYHCFGCGVGGNGITFLMELGKQSFADTIVSLAQRYQIPLKTIQVEQRQEIQRQISIREQLYEILALTATFYQKALRQPEGSLALEYLKVERQLSEETIQQFQLGFAPAGWDAVYRYLVELKRYPVALVEQAGLIKQRKDSSGYYDRFRNRIIIPIADSSGRIIAFGSRIQPQTQIHPQKTDEPKYLNSPETPLFDKGKTLFALDKARQSIIRQDRVIVVEGYFDAIALHAFGITNVVASLGTAFSKSQLTQLLRYTESKQIILNFDADSAGIQATQKAIVEIEPLIYSGQVQLRVLNLPQGKDADEYLQSSPDAENEYRTSVENAPLWLDWQINQILADRNLKQADQFQQVAQGIVRLLCKIDNYQLRNYYLTQAAELLSQGNGQYFKQLQENLGFQVNKYRQKKAAIYQDKNAPQSLPVASEKQRLEQAESLILHIYIHCPSYRKEIIEILEEKDLIFTLASHRFLWQQIQEVESQINLDQDINDRLLSILQDKMVYFPKKMSILSKFFYLTDHSKQNIDYNAHIVWRQAIASLEGLKLEKSRRYYLDKINQINSNYSGKNLELIQNYMQEINSIDQQIKELKKVIVNSD
jgi:DNA primase